MIPDAPALVRARELINGPNNIFKDNVTIIDRVARGQPSIKLDVKFDESDQEMLSDPKKFIENIGFEIKEW